MRTRPTHAGVRALRHRGCGTIGRASWRSAAATASSSIGTSPRTKFFTRCAAALCPWNEHVSYNTPAYPRFKRFFF